jgi:methylenetetrahydrofolate dehydrogenase (NADP+)/methenyltetrahydrofolate cyclohydrolase
MLLLDGKLLSENIKAEIAAEVDVIRQKGGKIPHLAAVLVGENPASQVYVNSKIKSCEQVGFKSSMVRRDADLSEAELLEIVHNLNNDPDVDGFIVQLPLPKHINEEKIILAIDHRKDVDGFHPVNFGRMAQGMSAFLPATPFGIMEMLRRYNIETAANIVWCWAGAISSVRP